MYVSGSQITYANSFSNLIGTDTSGEVLLTFSFRSALCTSSLSNLVPHLEIKN